MSNKTDVWMPFYIGDYIADTIGFSFAQHGLYVMLIFAYWRNKGPLSGSQFNAIMLQASVEDAKRIKTMFQNRGEKWHHKRINSELRRACELMDTNKTRATIAANARWKKKKDSCLEHSSSTPQAMLGDAHSHSHSHSDIYIELPAQFPKTAEAAVKLCSLQNIPEEFVRLVWDKAMSRGGRDAKEIPIRSWTHYVATEHGYHRANPKPDKDKLKREVKREVKQVLKDPKTYKSF